MEEKNFIIFMVATAILIMLWLTVFGQKPKPKPGKDQVVAGSTVAKPAGLAGNTAAPAALPGSTPVSPAITATPTPASAGPAPAPPVPLVVAKTVSATTDVYQIQFTSQGAAPTSWLLEKYPIAKCYPSRIDLKWPPLTRVPACGKEINANCCDHFPVDMVDKNFAAPNYPFISRVTVDDFKVPTNQNWEIESPDLVLSAGNTAGEVAFRTSLPDGRVLRKIYRFHQSRYDVELYFTVSGGAKPKAAGVDLAMFYRYIALSMTSTPTWNYRGPEFHDGQRGTQIKPEDVIKAGVLERPSVNWAAFTSEYFLTSILAEDKAAVNFVLQYLGPEEDKGNKKKSKDLVGWVKVSASEDDLKQGVAARVRLFVGPKDKAVLIKVRPSLQYSIDYGSLGLVVEFLISCLVLVHKLVPNYGVTIIICTVLLRMAMFPLTYTGQKSMKQMQKLQPEIKKLREKYPDDRMKQNEEMQALWRRHKINPMMGCLPMLLQFPVFIAFYKALIISIELRQAPFVSWIIDLSARDPLYVWPVLMGATQVVTQKMTPTQMDPVQAKMFMIMPIVFMYILRDFPAGLLIYWTVQNLVGIAQQLYINSRPD